MARIAIDFDGVIHDWSNPVPGRKLGPPLPDAREAVTRLKEAGHEIIIHSCNLAGVIADWMAYFQIPYSSIWQDHGKPVAEVYIDDKGLYFSDWKQTMEELKKREINV